VPEEIIIKANDRKLRFTGTIQRYLDGFREWDASTGSVYQSAKDLPQGSLCIDAGANIGIMAIALAAQRPDFHIIAIEPVPDNAECLRRNILTNSIDNVEVVEAALSDHQGIVSMTNAGPWSAVRQDAPLTCACITLDDFADSGVAFLKIDAEGFEPNILAGAGQLLAGSKPIIHMEFNTLALVLLRYDPISFADALFSNFDVIGMYREDHFLQSPGSGVALVHQNVSLYGGVTDLLMRPRQKLPSLDEMIQSPQMLAMLAAHGPLLPRLRKKVLAMYGEVRRVLRGP
jgi:FkbM family methyltransferase